MKGIYVVSSCVVGTICFLAGFGLSNFIDDALPLVKPVQAAEREIPVIFDLDAVEQVERIIESRQELDLRLEPQLDTYAEIAESDSTSTDIIDNSGAEIPRSSSLEHMAGNPKPRISLHRKNWVNQMAYPELAGAPTSYSMVLLKEILPDESEDSLYDLLVELHTMEPSRAITMLVALSKTYQSGDTDKTSFYDSVTAVSPSLGSMAFALEATLHSYCQQEIDAKDMLRLVNNRQIAGSFARIYQKRRVKEIEGWVRESQICSRIGNY